MSMVAKELDPYVSNHNYEQAILTAQEDLAFQLKINFSGNSTVKKLGMRLFNGLRFEMNNYAIQIDHLIIHKYGIIIIENRAENADIDINILGQWTQTYDKKHLKITSPIEQGQRKIEFLKSVLNANHRVLRLKGKNKQFDFNEVAFDLIVSISDSGNINTSSGNIPFEVCRMHNITETILEIAEQQKRDASSFLAIAYDKKKTLAPDELFKLTAFFRKNHKPLDRTKFRTEDTQISHKTKKQKPSYYQCENCKSKQVFVEHNGGYHISCLDCGHISEIDKTCPSCNKQAYVRREQNQYYLECENCLSKELIFVDGSIIPSTV